MSELFSLSTASVKERCKNVLINTKIRSIHFVNTVGLTLCELFVCLYVCIFFLCPTILVNKDVYKDVYDVLSIKRCCLAQSRVLADWKHLEKITAVASLACDWVMVHHKTSTQAHNCKKITKVKDFALVFRSVALTHFIFCKKTTLSKHFWHCL